MVQGEVVFACHMMLTLGLEPKLSAAAPELLPTDPSITWATPCTACSTPLQIGLRMHALLLNHMQQFRYNAGGALRWKGDVAQYCELLRAMEQRELKEKLEGVQVGRRMGFATFT